MNAVSSRENVLIMDMEMHRRFFRLAALISSLGMTFLTYAKETALFGRAINGWETVAYLISSKFYYPIWFCHLLALVALTAWMWNQGRKSILINVAIAMVVVNFALLSANNVINVLTGRPLHCTHQGIGW